MSQETIYQNQKMIEKLKIKRDDLQKEITEKEAEIQKIEVKIKKEYRSLWGYILGPNQNLIKYYQKQKEELAESIKKLDSRRYEIWKNIIALCNKLEYEKQRSNFPTVRRKCEKRKEVDNDDDIAFSNEINNHHAKIAKLEPSVTSKSTQSVNKVDLNKNLKTVDNNNDDNGSKSNFSLTDSTSSGFSKLTADDYLRIFQLYLVHIVDSITYVLDFKKNIYDYKGIVDWRCENDSFDAAFKHFKFHLSNYLLQFKSMAFDDAGIKLLDVRRSKNLMLKLEGAGCGETDIAIVSNIYYSLICNQFVIVNIELKPTKQFNDENSYQSVAQLLAANLDSMFPVLQITTDLNEFHAYILTKVDDQDDLSHVLKYVLNGEEALQLISLWIEMFNKNETTKGIFKSVRATQNNLRERQYKIRQNMKLPNHEPVESKILYCQKWVDRHF